MEHHIIYTHVLNRPDRSSARGYRFRCIPRPADCHAGCRNRRPPPAPLQEAPASSRRPRMAAARCARGLSQQAMAAQCNLLGWSLSRATLSKIESRLRRVNDAELWLLAAALGAEMKDLFPPGSRRRPPASFIAVARHSED